MEELRELTLVELDQVAGGWGQSCEPKPQPCQPQPCGCGGGGIVIGIGVAVGVVLDL